MSQPLDLLFLGSGNAYASGRYWSSFLLNGRYLFDASPVALPHLKRSNIDVDEVESVFVSHFHGDHFFGLPFLQLNYVEMGTRTKELMIVGPPGIEQRLRTVTEAGFPHLPDKDRAYKETYVDLYDGLRGEVGDMKYWARSVEHAEGMDCFGFRAEIGGRRVAYSGDSQMCEALVDLAEGSDVFVVECTCWDGGCGFHVTPDDLRELRRRLGPTPTFILTHLEGGERDLGIENVLLAEDLKLFSF